MNELINEHMQLLKIGKTTHDTSTTAEKPVAVRGPHIIYSTKLFILSILRFMYETISSDLGLITTIFTLIYLHLQLIQ